MSIVIRTPHPSIARVAKTLGIDPERMKQLEEFVMSAPPSKRAALAKKAAAKRASKAAKSFTSAGVRTSKKALGGVLRTQRNRRDGRERRATATG